MFLHSLKPLAFWYMVNYHILMIVKSNKIQELINKRSLLFADAYKTIIRSDHWLDGAGLPVSKPKADSQAFKTINPEYQRLFTYKNILLQVTRRSRDAISALNWRFVPNREMGSGTVTETINEQSIEVQQQEEPSSEEQALMLEADSALTVWWDEQGVWQKMQTAILYGLFARENEDSLSCSVVLRLFVPTRENSLIDGLEVLEASNLLSALRKIHLEIPNPLSSGVIRDADHIVTEGFVDSGNGKDAMLEVVTIENQQTIIKVTRVIALVLEAL
jgi:hypothetical protein